MTSGKAPRSRFQGDREAPMKLRHACGADLGVEAGQQEVAYKGMQAPRTYRANALGQQADLLRVTQ